MALEDLEIRVLLVIGLLALVPIALYGLGRSGSAAVMATVNVFLVLGALAIAMGPVEPDHVGH